MWDQDLNFVPGLAETWEIDADGNYIFNLRQGVLFHNGNEMTAADVKYSMDMALAPPEPGVAVSYLANITGTEIVDDYTVKVTMSKLDPTLPGTMAWGGYTPIVPANFYDDYNAAERGDRHRSVQAGRVRPGRCDRHGSQPGLLESRYSLHRQADPQDPHRRADPCGRAPIR